jgi:hypothetical protein
MSKLSDAVTRVRAITARTPAPDESATYAKLMKRYLSSAAAMCRQEGFAPSSPLFNAANLVGGIAVFAEVMPQIEAAADHVVGVYRRVACVNHMLWCAAQDRQLPLPLQYPDLFDPFVELVELGASISLHHGELILPGGAFTLTNWLQRY